MQALFQFDSGRDGEHDAVLRSLQSGESPGSDVERLGGFELATRVWERRAEADAATTALSLDWPVHRQPRVDRNLIRLGWYEITVAGTSPAHCINDIVEIAKAYASEKSAAFVNAVLDQMAKPGKPT